MVCDGSDDTLIFVDNLVELLGMYDHTMYYYIGTIMSPFIQTLISLLIWDMVELAML